MSPEEYLQLREEHPGLRLPGLDGTALRSSKQTVFCAVLILSAEGTLDLVNLKAWTVEEFRSLRSAAVLSGGLYRNQHVFMAESAHWEENLNRWPSGANLRPFNGRGHPTLHPREFAPED